MVVVRLNLQVAGRAGRARESRQHVLAGQRRVQVGRCREWRLVERLRHVFAEASVVGVALQGEAAPAIERPVRAKAALAGAPAVVVVAVGVKLRAAIESLEIRAIVQRAGLTAVPNAAEGLIFRAAAGRDEQALGVRGALGDDVDDSVHGIGAPQRSARTANHLDVIDVIEQRVLRFPVRASEQRRVDRAAVDQHEDRSRQTVGKAAHANRPDAGADARDLHAGREAQHFGNRSRARSADVFLRDHEDGRGDLNRRLGAARRRGDLQIEQVFQRHPLEVGCGLRERRWGRSQRGQQAGEGNRDGQAATPAVRMATRGGRLLQIDAPRAGRRFGFAAALDLCNNASSLRPAVGVGPAAAVGNTGNDLGSRLPGLSRRRAGHGTVAQAVSAVSSCV